MRLGELVNAYFCHLDRVYEVRIDLHPGAKRAGERAALERRLRALATAEVRAAAGAPLRGIGFDAAFGDHETVKVGLRRRPATAHAAPLGNSYDGASASSASSAGTSTGATMPSAPASAVSDGTGPSSASGAISSVGWPASAWWESRPQ